MLRFVRGRLSDRKKRQATTRGQRRGVYNGQRLARVFTAFCRRRTLRVQGVDSMSRVKLLAKKRIIFQRLSLEQAKFLDTRLDDSRDVNPQLITRLHRDLRSSFPSRIVSTEVVEEHCRAHQMLPTSVDG